MATAQQTHFRDQVQAATTDAGRLFDAIGKKMNGDVLVTGGEGTFVSRIVEDRRNRIALGDKSIMVCPHVLGSPAVVVMPTWTRKLCCTHCVSALPKPTTEDDHLCDECGAVGPDLVHESFGRHGIFIVLGGVCSACRDAASPRTEARPSRRKKRRSSR